jgi:hypothetical protein
MVDAEGASHILRAYAYATALLTRSKLRPETHVFGPDIQFLETDFKGLSDQVDREAGALSGDLVHHVSLDGAAIRETLVGFRKETITAHTQLRNMQQFASRHSMENIARSVEVGQMGEAVAKKIRDFASTTLVVGATVISAGTTMFGVTVTAGAGSAFALGAGAVLKGFSRYQEKGDVSGAVLEATSTVVIGCFTYAAKVRWAEQTLAENVTVLLVGAQLDGLFEAAKSMTRGSTARQAFHTAAARAGIHIVTRGLVDPLVDNIPLPTLVRINNATGFRFDGGTFRGTAASVFSRSALRTASKGLIDGWRSAIAPNIDAGRSPACSPQVSKWVDCARTLPEVDDARRFVQKTAIYSADELMTSN